MRLGHVGIEFQSAEDLSLSFRILALLHQRDREVKMGGSETRLRRDRRTEFASGILILSLAEQRVSKIVAGLGEIRLAFHGSSELFVRVCFLLHLPEHAAKIVVRLGVLSIRIEGLPKRGHSAFQIALVPKLEATIIVAACL